MKINDFTPFFEKAIVNYGNDARIVSVMQRAKEGQDITLGFIGGSITHGTMATVPNKSYARIVYEWFEETFAPAKVHYKNAAIGGTDSVYGVHRMRQDLLIARPDIVIVEFSVNDLDVDNVELAYEAMLVRLLMEPQKPGVVIVNTMFYNNGENKQDVHNRIAMKYNLPIISIKNGLWDQLESGQLKSRQLTVDDLHPNDLGHEVMANMIISQLSKMYDKASKEQELSREKMLALAGDNPFLRSFLLRNTELEPKVNEGWIIDQSQPTFVGDMFTGGWSIEGHGGSIVFEIHARRVAVQYKRYAGGSGGIVLAYIDHNEDPIILDADFSGGWGDTVQSTEVVKDPESNHHTLRLVFSGDQKDEAEFYITAFMIAP